MSERTEIFKNDEFGEIRTTMIDGTPWFVGKDVATALGYRNTKDALRSHVDEEDKIMGSRNATPSITDSMGRIQRPAWINESGMYALIFGSKLPSAKRFKHWVTSEVLPALRKTGTYSMAQTQTPLPQIEDKCQQEEKGLTRDEKRMWENRGFLEGVYLFETRMLGTTQQPSAMFSKLSPGGKRTVMRGIFGEEALRIYG